MKPVEFHPAALYELIKAAEYYEGKVEGLGQRFLDAIEQCVADVSESPEQWPFFLMNVRRCLLERFPYMLVYLNETDRVYILATMHQKRKPGYWKKRQSE